MFGLFKKKPAQQPVDSEITKFQGDVRDALSEMAEDMGAVLLKDQDDVRRFLEWMANPERSDKQQ